MLVDHSQQPPVQGKQTFLVTAPSDTLGCSSVSQLGALVAHLSIGGHEEGILVPAAPSKRNQPGPIEWSQLNPRVYVTFLLALVRL